MTVPEFNLENSVIYLYISALVFFLGACMGSLLNVCIYRIPLGQSTVRPRSHCPNCQAMIAWYDNVPLLSYVALGGKCRHCGVKISARYLLVETLTACLFFVIWLKFGPAVRPLGLAAIADPGLVPVYWLFVFGLILGTFVDFDHMIIPDRVTIGGIVAGIVLSWLVPSMHNASGAWASLSMSVFAAALGAGLLWAVARIGTFVFKKDAMGMGDVKLLGAIGAFLGWRAVFFTVMISSLTGAILGIALVLMRKKEMQGRIPYGPHLALAALLWILWGQSMWNWYMDLFFFDAAGPSL